MTIPITGIHHITAIASDPQRNVDFYAGLLGLRLVKKTVNFDDPTAYHLYFGSEFGSPSSIVTFFYWPGDTAAGRVGAGQATALTFSAPSRSLDFWKDRLARTGVEAQRIERSGESALHFMDPDGIPVEIVGVASDEREGWAGSNIPEEHALLGLHAIALAAREPQSIEALLIESMGFRLIDRTVDRDRFAVGLGSSGTFADIISDASLLPGSSGVGTIHHVAWSVADEETLHTAQEMLQAAGYGVSPVMDRTYFRSIYYRTAAGILFELATATPGFAIDEPAESLGERLKLPPQFEPSRGLIETQLPPVKTPAKLGICTSNTKS